MSDEIARIHELMTQLASQKAGLQNAMDMAEKRERELKQRIEALEAQELGFVQSLCSQSEEIGRLKQRIETLEKALKAEEIFCRKSGDIDGADALAALLPGRGDGG